MYYLLTIILLLNTVIAGFYNEGDFVSTEHQNIEMTTCYAGNGYEEGDQWKLADWNGTLNGGNYSVIVITMAASWWGPCHTGHTGPAGELHHDYLDNDHVKFIIAFSDPNQPYSCQQWGEMPNGGACQIFIDDSSSIWSLFNSGGAFPSTAFINHEIQVYDLMNNAGSWSINSRISDMLDDCGSNCDPDPCSDVSNGDVNADGIINITDAIVVIQYILGNNITECIPDINQDNLVDVNDIVLLLAFILD